MKKVVITGANRGIGQAIAEKFLKEGWQVYGSSTSGQGKINDPNFTIYQLDLANPQSIANFATNIINKAKKVEVLINNAGVQIGEKENILFSAEGLRKTLEVNLIGPADLTLKLIPIIKRGGVIINISSSLGSLTDGFGAYEPTYSISKTAVNKLTQVLAVAFKDQGITVSSVDPGWVRTDMGGSSAPRDPNEPAEEIYKLATTHIDSGYFWFQNRKRSW